ncbi:probable E3 ubiquitin-protein ligase HERC4 isoform X2 [Venturia canescens]|nr:probable E3 ubiquitin-protein ligase HERC4 isoform X2 [Venturia canescens]XP_043288776.1 probable E3 ubiquitin-protein ligase HERC4 isoform X2 [Venturia canescens]XP_043288786.1 probable E3 ubiquitin-protein ligase HERC4 isoform X2 [Venturia canescens]
MFCWGSTVHGELGLGGIEDEFILTPREVCFEKATQINQIACGDNYTVIVTRDGQIYSCGNNDYGQLGHEKPRKRLQLIPGLEAFVFKRVACGSSHTVAINEWGQLFSWGCNTDGQLGFISPNGSEPSPRMVKALGTSVIIQIACGLSHVVALTNNGEIYAWGSNNEGQLGFGQELLASNKPLLVNSLVSIPIAFIACGGYHTIAVSKSGAVYGWGRNTFSQLGISGTGSIYLPCQLRTLRRAKVCYVSCGENFSAFLTVDGGVFTCGAGMYGQLGHGSIANEMLPRQIVELMGSVVTQISCGKRHMLAVVSSRGRVYAWGLGGAGQLGTRVTQSVTTPQVVLGPWVSPNGSALCKVDNPMSEYSVDCVIKRVSTGSDHCFATVTQRKDNIPPDDFRVTDPESQILTVTKDRISVCLGIPMGAPVDHDLMTYLETVFRSQACMNASFLIENDAHYTCSSKHHGVDTNKVIEIYGTISEFVNTTINELIYTSITEGLIPSLRSSPPDVECLRIYLTLPMYSAFTEPENHRNLQTPFAKAVLLLKSEAQKIVGSWWSKAPVQIFERLVRVYKLLVLYFIKESKNKEHQQPVTKNVELKFALDLLHFINKLNQSADDGLRVPYGTFHLPELREFIEVNTDYVEWLMDKNSQTHQKIYFCHYPFLFDALAKTILLETDQAIQMHSAMSEAATRALTHMLFAPYPSGSVDARHGQFITFNVSRENLVADTLAQLSLYESSDLKKPLRVKFHGEEAEDAGGVKKEFFLLLLKEILDPKYGMFKQYEETRTIWFSEESLEEKVMYLLIGVLCGLAIYNFIIIDLPFPLVLYKKLLNEPVGLSDVKDISPTIARSLQSLVDYQKPDLEEVFCLNFEISREVFGEHVVHELVPGGSKIPVTQSNKMEFINLYVDHMLNKSVEPHFQAFYEGFHKVCGGRVLELFHSHELMAVVVGNENYDWNELEKSTTYKNGYSKDDPTIVLFWQIFHELSLEEKKKFLLFLTGSDRIPIQGMTAIKITIQPMTDERFLPVAHTCFNLLDLPRYKTREKLRYKLLQAIQQTQGFSLV